MKELTRIVDGEQCSNTNCQHRLMQVVMTADSVSGASIIYYYECPYRVTVTK